MNASKKKDSRAWRKWSASGAVAKPVFPHGALVIDAIGIHYGGLSAGYSTLALGKKVVASGPDFTTEEPICCALVTTNEKKYDLGVVLDKIPGNAVML